MNIREKNTQQKQRYQAKYSIMIVFCSKTTQHTCLYFKIKKPDINSAINAIKNLQYLYHYTVSYTKRLTKSFVKVTKFGISNFLSNCKIEISFTDC